MKSTDLNEAKFSITSKCTQSISEVDEEEMADDNNLKYKLYFIEVEQRMTEK
jgi:hypothetical protein